MIDTFIYIINFLIQLYSEKRTIAWIRDFAGPSKSHDKLDQNLGETEIAMFFFQQIHGG